LPFIFAFHEVTPRKQCLKKKDREINAYIVIGSATGLGQTGANGGMAVILATKKACEEKTVTAAASR
jgi:hypothetical protein